MTGHIHTIRPARAAIAAVLALSATPVLAQVAAPPPVAQTMAPAVPDAPPAASVAPPAAMSAAPVFAPTQPVVQATPSVEDNRAAAIAAAEAEAAAKPAAPVRRAAPRVAQAPIERVAPTTAPVTRAEAPAPVAAPVTSAPVAPVVAEQAVTPDAAPVTAAPVTAEVAQTDNALLWAMGGAALLLAGLGGAALVRRRRPSEAIGDEAVFAATPVVTPREAILPRPAFAPTPMAAPAMPTGDQERTLAAMVAAAPSEENPFLTRAKRTRRAQHLLAQRAVRTASAVPFMETQAAQPTPSAAVDRSQMVYRFSGQGARPGSLKPRTN